MTQASGFLEQTIESFPRLEWVNSGWWSLFDRRGLVYGTRGGGCCSRRPAWEMKSFFVLFFFSSGEEVGVCVIMGRVLLRDREKFGGYNERDRLAAWFIRMDYVRCAAV